MIPSYRTFQANLQGYAEISFDEFCQVASFRKARVWTEEQRQLVLSLATRGASYALQTFVGANHPEAIKLFGAMPRHPDLFPREELEKRLRGLMRSCRAAAWEPETYSAYLAHLDKGTEFKDRAGVVPDEFGASYREGSAAYRRVIQAAFAAAKASALSQRGARSARGGDGSSTRTRSPT